MIQHQEISRLILTCKLFMSVLWTWATARDSSWLISKLFRDNVEFRLVDPLEMKSIFNKYTCVISLYFYELNLQAGWPTQKYFLLGKMPFFEINISGEFASGDAQKCKNVSSLWLAESLKAMIDRVAQKPSCDLSCIYSKD